MRVENWERLLADHVTKTPPFRWGVSDCALWCADWGRKATGVDFAADWRGRYGSEEELRALMAERGFRTAAEIADACLPGRPVGFARRGDVVLHPQGALGVCGGVWSHFLTASGVARHDTLACPAAWAVD